MVESNGLENRHTGKPVSGVRISLSPPYFAKPVTLSLSKGVWHTAISLNDLSILNFYLTNSIISVRLTRIVNSHTILTVTKNKFILLSEDYYVAANSSKALSEC